jgi:flagellar biosynthesis/type III secretory pathway protein FliH
MKEKINQWLAFIDMERGDLLEMAKNENDEIKNAVEEYTVLTGNAEIKRLAEIRLMSKLEENSALETARIKGTEEGLKQGKEEGLTQGKKEGIKAGRNEEKKSIAQKMKKSGKFSMKQIIEITGLTKDEIDLLE